MVTVSFDPRETPDAGGRQEEDLPGQLRAARRPPRAGTSSRARPRPIEQLTEAVGFRYVYDAKQDQFLHTSGIMILTPRGKISRYFYDIQFPPRDLRLGLVEASAEKIGSPTDQVLLYCFHYDPASGKYTANILNFVRAGGVLTVVAVVGMVWFLVADETDGDAPGTSGRAASALQG